MELEKEKKYLVINTSGIINYNIKKYKKMKQWIKNIINKYKLKKTTI
jgi:hypothetical protein